MGEISRRTPEQIQREIELLRDDMALIVDELEETVRNKLDLARPVRQRPLVFAGGALALGFFLGRL